MSALEKILWIIATAILFFTLAEYSHAQTIHGNMFTWVQSPTPGITGNTLKCGTVTKVYPLSWKFTAPTTSYDWLTNDPVNVPVQGQTYFCVVTATKGAIESDPSPELQFPFPVVPVPPPGMQRSEH